MTHWTHQPVAFSTRSAEGPFVLHHCVFIVEGGRIIILAVGSRGVWFSPPFVCLLFRAISQKLMQLGSPNLTCKRPTMSPGNPFVLGSIGQRSRSRVNWRGSLHSYDCWRLQVSTASERVSRSALSRPVTAAAGYQLRVDGDRKHGDDGQCPDAEDDESSEERRPTSIARPHRAADSHAPVGAHRRQREHAGERARRRDREVRLQRRHENFKASSTPATLSKKYCRMPQVERFFRQSRNNLNNMFNLFRLCRNNRSTCSIRHCCFDSAAGADGA